MSWGDRGAEVKPAGKRSYLKLKGQRAANGVVMSDPGGADGLREPGKAEWPMVTAGNEGGRSAGIGVRTKG